MKLWFGLHKGEELSDVPDNYLHWLVEEFDVTPNPKYNGPLRGDKLKFVIERNRDLVAAATEELENRE